MCRKMERPRGLHREANFSGTRGHVGSCRLGLGLGWMFFFVFFLLNIFTQDYPLGWVPLQMRGPARNIAQTYKNNIYTKHDMYNYKNIYTGPGP